MDVHVEAADNMGRTTDERNARSAASHDVAEVDADVTTPSGATPLLTAAQLAERWQVPVQTIYAWARRNAIPHYRAGRLLRFDPVAVEDHFRHHGFAEEILADPATPGEAAFTLLRA